MRQDTLALKRFWFWQASTTLQGGVHGGRVLNAVWGCLVTPCGTTTASGMSLHGEGLPRTAPNTMNRFGIIMSELGFCDLGLYNFEGQMQESTCFISFPTAVVVVVVVVVVVNRSGPTHMCHMYIIWVHVAGWCMPRLAQGCDLYRTGKVSEV